jgi:hypothetical protein
VKKLTDLSDELMHVPNRVEYLKQEIKKINQALPAAVYIPFVSGKQKLI